MNERPRWIRGTRRCFIAVLSANFREFYCTRRAARAGSRLLFSPGVIRVSFSAALRSSAVYRTSVVHSRRFYELPFIIVKSGTFQQFRARVHARIRYKRGLCSPLPRCDADAHRARSLITRGWVFNNLTRRYNPMLFLNIYRFRVFIVFYRRLSFSLFYYYSRFIITVLRR